MRLQRVDIRNYLSFEDVSISCSALQALVGKNNSGKSNVFRAIQLLLEPSTGLISEESFFHKETERTIEVVGWFGDLNEWEEAELRPWLTDGDLRLARRFTIDAEGSVAITTVAYSRAAEASWLREDLISGDQINEWWSARESLVVAGLDFAATLGGAKPKVGEWKTAAAKFVEEHRAVIPMVDVEMENPKGYPNVLKGTLPQFIYVPAVRDLADETKVLKSNPFGLLINSILQRIPEESRRQLTAQLASLAARLNRSPGGDRLQEIAVVEQRLNELLGELMDCDVELEVAVPDLRLVFGGTQIIANDGVRTPIGMKGHGLQRSMILTILRHYAEMAREQAGDHDGLGYRSTLIAIEEPELYLHPQAQRTLYSVVRDIATAGDQVFYCTHSSLMIDVGHFDEIAIMRAAHDGDFRSTSVTQLSIAQLQEDLELRKGIKATETGIREQYMNAFGPAVNDGFFAGKVVIVEGPSELYCLPIYAGAVGLNLDRENIAVVHGDGKGQIDRLLRIFNGFRIPTFTWFDGDRSTQDVRTRQKTLELLELHGHPKERIEDVVTEVRPGFAVLEEKLEVSLASEVDNYEIIIARAAKVIGPSGKPLPQRYLAQQLVAAAAAAGDPSAGVPPTIARIITAIRDLEFQGMILKRKLRDEVTPEALVPLPADDAPAEAQPADNMAAL
jgi:putative ATP-dependent endonuclease of OLD family